MLHIFLHVKEMLELVVELVHSMHSHDVEIS